MVTLTIDVLDARLIGLLRAEPNLPVIEMARRLDVARGTVQARLSRLHDGGVITGYGPDVDAGAAGYEVLAFTVLEIAQGSGDSIVAGLTAIPEVLEVFAITGPGDLHLRIAARSNEHLHEVLQQVLDLPGITRTETKLALHAALQRSVADLVVADLVADLVLDPRVADLVVDPGVADPGVADPGVAEHAGGRAGGHR